LFPSSPNGKEFLPQKNERRSSSETLHHQLDWKGKINFKEDPRRNNLNWIKENHAFPYDDLEAEIFALVTASVAIIYITQPVLPVLGQKFSTDLVLVSFSGECKHFSAFLSHYPALPTFGLFLSEGEPSDLCKSWAG
jgi:hypothetical protein